ncbi:MAG: hypothetical protein ABFS02_11605, partial [Pseudomonadota bacterium]
SMRLPSESLSASYSNTPVDAVYLWVDGDSPTGSAERAAYGNRGASPALADGAISRANKPTVPCFKTYWKKLARSLVCKSPPSRYPNASRTAC